MDYYYLGDRLTLPRLRGKSCIAVKSYTGKCIRGRNGNMLVQFEDGSNHVIIARLLRKIKK